MVMSTKFNIETCREVLDKVDGTQNGIQAASARLVFWKRSASDVVRCWEHTFAKADMEKRLVLIYLANDIAQTSRRSGREYIEAFHKALPEAFKHMMKHSDEPVQQRLKKLVRVWRDRNVWGNRALAIYNDMVKGVSEPAQPRQPAADKAGQGVPEDLQKVGSLLRGAQQAQAAVQDAVATDASALALEYAEDQKMDLDDQKGDLEAASEALNTVIAAHRKHQQIQDSIVSELRRLADAQAAEMQTSARKLQEAQQQQQAIQTLLGRDDGSVGMGRTLASAGVPPSAPDLMSGSPRPSATAHGGEIMYTPTSHPGPASLAGSAPDTVPIDPLSAPRSKGRRGDPRIAAAASMPLQTAAAPEVSLPCDIPTAAGPADSIEQLANLDPTESANVLAAIIAEAPQDLAEQFGQALAEHVYQPGEAV